jgi:ribosome-binding factor A
MENRSQQHHRDRLGEALREEISEIIEGELGDPRIGLATVTEVQFTPDGRGAHVLVNVTGSEQEAAETLKGLEAAKGYVRREVASRLRLRHAPELYFRLDRSQQSENRINDLLQRVKRRST